MTAEDYFQLGNNLEKLGKYQDAIEQYKKCVAIEPKHAEAYYKRGNNLTALGKYEEAIEQYKKAVEFDPKFAKAYNNWGGALTALGKYAEAIEKFKKAVEIDPTYANAYYNWGSALHNLGKYEEAIEQYKKAVEFEPKHAEAYANWGVVLDTLEMHEEARAKLSQAYALGFTDYSNTKLHDKELLKFRAITKNTLVSLANKNIFFQTPSKLNDPLDCPIVNIEEVLGETLKKVLSAIKIFSVGNKDSYKNILMWSHYADNHKGICIGYKFKPALFEKHKMCINKVTYKKELNDQYDDSVSTSINHGFFQKYVNWQYEKEHRVIWLPDNDASTVDLGDGIEISSITFGYKCNQEDIKTIKNLVGGKVDYHQIKYSHKSTLAREPLE